MSGPYKTLGAIALWTLFITGMVSILVPVILGIATGALAGTINSVEDGQLWYYRHGLSFLIGIGSFIAFFYGLRNWRKPEN